MYSRKADYSMDMVYGLPSNEFLNEAWASEPLTNMLRFVDIAAALPLPEQNISLIAKLKNGQVIGQCSANFATKYWGHIKTLDVSLYSDATYKFIKIHKKAVEDEQQYLLEQANATAVSLHNAGIAVLPEYRGNRLGYVLCQANVEILVANKADFIFAETTNKYSANIFNQLGFFKLKEYPYKDLATELSIPEISASDDSFCVWARKVSRH